MKTDPERAKEIRAKRREIARKLRAGRLVTTIPFEFLIFEGGKFKRVPSMFEPDEQISWKEALNLIRKSLRIF